MQWHYIVPLVAATKQQCFQYFLLGFLCELLGGKLLTRSSCFLSFTLRTSGCSLILVSSLCSYIKSVFNSSVTKRFRDHLKFQFMLKGEARDWNGCVRGRRLLHSLSFLLNCLSLSLETFLCTRKYCVSVTLMAPSAQGGVSFLHSVFIECSSSTQSWWGMSSRAGYVERRLSPEKRWPLLDPQAVSRPEQRLLPITPRSAGPPLPGVRRAGSWSRPSPCPPQHVWQFPLVWDVSPVLLYVLP